MGKFVWAATSENVPSDVCTKRRLSLHICLVCLCARLHILIKDFDFRMKKLYPWLSNMRPVKILVRMRGWAHVCKCTFSDVEPDLMTEYVLTLIDRWAILYVASNVYIQTSREQRDLSVYTWTENTISVCSSVQTDQGLRWTMSGVQLL